MSALNHEEVQDRLTELGVEGLDDWMQAHLVTCTLCQEFAASLRELDRALLALPPIDASDALVAETIALVQKDPTRVTERPRWRRLIAPASFLAASLLVATAILVAPKESSRPSPSLAAYAPPTATVTESPLAAMPPPAAVVAEKAPQAAPRAAEVDLDYYAQKPAPKSGGFDDLLDERAAKREKRDPAKIAKNDGMFKALSHNGYDNQMAKADNDRHGSVVGGVVGGVEGGALGSVPRGDAQGVGIDNEKTTQSKAPRQYGPTGYWANTYVPGDPYMRALGLRLAEQGGTRIDRGAHAAAQPFDAPQNAAMALSLQADRRGITEQTSMRVQIALKGAERRSRARPAMNVAVVLDLRSEPSSSAKAAMRALIEALEAAKDTGDHFSLIVAGAQGGEIVPEAAFKHGPLLVAMMQLLDGKGTATGPKLKLLDALGTAIGTVIEKDDPNAPLGTSTILFVTGARLGTDAEALAGAAHEAAINGVPVSVIGLQGSVPQELDALALSGQGNRRFIGLASEAKATISDELSAVSRVVARALRLRIRLAPGVQLVNILGSYPLNEARAEAVRQAEKSVDKRISKNLGVSSDRGTDEDGIQIVIPTFNAGDSHVILLDLVVPNAGPAVDVRVRYKDLVYLKNGVTDARLTLERGIVAPTPAEVNVWKNVLTRNVADALTRAGNAAAIGDTANANRELDIIIAALRQADARVLADPDIQDDLRLLTEYKRAIYPSSHNTPPQTLADSLRYAGFLKLFGATR